MPVKQHQQPVGTDLIDIDFGVVQCGDECFGELKMDFLTIEFFSLSQQFFFGQP